MSQSFYDSVKSLQEKGHLAIASWQNSAVAAKKKDIISTCYVLIMMIESISDLKRAELFGDYVFIYFLTDARYARPFAEQHHLEVQEKLILV